MQTLAIDSQFIPASPASNFYPIKDGSTPNAPSKSGRGLSLKAAYTQIFKENRDLDFHHNASLDSAYLNGQLSTRDLVCELLCSDMYVNYVLALNSNFRFVELCFERVLGRQATQREIQVWSSLLASEGLRVFAENLTGCSEYSAVFGDDTVPYRRSLKLSSSNQGIPALPKELSIQRYQGEGNISQHFYSLAWKGGQPPLPARLFGKVLVAFGSIGLIGLIAFIAWLAVTSGSF